MQVRWLGHSCWFCEGSGVRLLTDPFGVEVGYRPLTLEVDLVTVSHDHTDHNDVGQLPGHPLVIRDLGVQQVGALRITGYPLYHDGVSGARRGSNIAFAWEMDGVRLCHLGDLGHLLDQQTVEAIGKVDLLMVPVGGVFTIDASAARQVVEQLRPRLVLPMHYQTQALKFQLGGLEEFTAYFKLVRHLKVLEVGVDTIPARQEVVVFDYQW